MAAALDLHTIYALENGIHAYLNDSAAFAKIFHGFQPEVVEVWRTTLLQHKPLFRSDGSRGVPEQPTPWVIVSLADDRAEERAISDFADRDADGSELLEFYITQTVRVTLYAWNTEILTALHGLIRAVSLIAEHAFLDAGYDGFGYDGCEALSQVEEMLTVELGVCVRPMTMTAKSRVQVTRPAEAPSGLSWFVQLDGIAISPAWGVVDGRLPDGTQIPAPGAGETE